jgi:hypothetical protein
MENSLNISIRRSVFHGSVEFDPDWEIAMHFANCFCRNPIDYKRYCTNYVNKESDEKG